VYLHRGLEGKRVGCDLLGIRFRAALQGAVQLLELGVTRRCHNEQYCRYDKQRALHRRKQRHVRVQPMCGCGTRKCNRRKGPMYLVEEQRYMSCHESSNSSYCGQLPSKHCQRV